MPQQAASVQGKRWNNHVCASDPPPPLFSPNFTSMRTCVLEEIFPNIVRNARTGVNKHRKWAKRGSSGDWDVDGTTAQEQAAYKRAMGWK